MIGLSFCVRSFEVAFFVDLLLLERREIRNDPSIYINSGINGLVSWDKAFRSINIGYASLSFLKFLSMSIKQVLVALNRSGHSMGER